MMSARGFLPCKIFFFALIVTRSLCDGQELPQQSPQEKVATVLHLAIPLRERIDAIVLNFQKDRISAVQSVMGNVNADVDGKTSKIERVGLGTNRLGNVQDILGNVNSEVNNQLRKTARIDLEPNRLVAIQDITGKVNQEVEKQLPKTSGVNLDSNRLTTVQGIVGNLNAQVEKQIPKLVNDRLSVAQGTIGNVNAELQQQLPKIGKVTLEKGRLPPLAILPQGIVKMEKLKKPLKAGLTCTASPGLFTEIIGIDEWCQLNCSQGNCPASHCICFEDTNPKPSVSPAPVEPTETTAAPPASEGPTLVPVLKPTGTQPPSRT